MDSREFSDLYFSAKEGAIFEDDFLKFPMMNFQYLLNSGQVAGKVFIDFSPGFLLHNVKFASKFFQEIILLKCSENSVMELNNWLHDRTGKYDWIYPSDAASELEGKRDERKDNEMHLKSSIKHIVKCDFEQEDIASPVVLPLADCVLIAWTLDAICKDEEECLKHLKKILKLLKPGGDLILFSMTDATYMDAGGERIDLFKHDENFVKNTMSELDLVTNYSSLQTRWNDSKFTDYEAVMVTVAHKEK